MRDTKQHTAPSVLFVGQAPRVSSLMRIVADVLAEKRPDIFLFFISLWHIVENVAHGNSDKSFKESAAKELFIEDYADDNGSLSTYIEKFKKLLNDVSPTVLVLALDQPGILQQSVDVARSFGIKVVILNENPLTFLQMGADAYITGIITKEIFPLCGRLPVQFNEVGDAIISAANKTLLWIKDKIKKPAPLEKIRYRGQSGADFMGVTGRIDYEELCRLGVKKESVEVIGWVRGDESLLNHRMSRQEVLDTIGFGSNDKYILFILQSFEYSEVPVRAYDLEEIMLSAKTFQKYTSGLKNVIAVHPAVNLEETKEKILRYNTNLELSFVQCFPDRLALYKNAEAIIGFFSSALLEAMIVGCPILTLDYVAYQLWYPFFLEYSAVAPVFHKHNLDNQIARLINDKSYIENMISNQRRLLRDVVDSAEGNSRYKAADLIIRAINSAT